VTRNSSAIWFFVLSTSLLLIVGCGGNSSTTATTPQSNPVPAVAALSPSAGTAGSPPQTLTINGTNFISTSTVTYNGTAHTATFVSSTQLTIVLSGSDQAKVGSFPVVVSNPTPGGGASNSVSFAVQSPVIVSDEVNNRVLIYDVPFSSDQNAQVVLGQANLTTAVQAMTAAGMNGPTATAVDGSGNLYVCDSGNNRVLQFQPPFTNGMNASLAIGQANLTSNASATTQKGLNSPNGLTFDNSGNLWVVDFGNNRVLEYEPPFTTNMNATVVIGQADFTSSATATTSTGFFLPSSDAFDTSGDLWVVDSANNRVLEFKTPLTTGMAASLVIGQPDFTSSGSANPPTAGSLNFPLGGITFDGTGNLWIGDTSNNRILEFKPTFSTGMNASMVLGQATFITAVATSTQSGLSSPFGVGFDTSGNLWAADGGNNRTLMYSPAFSAGQNATLVLGQPNFSAHGAANPPTASSENQPLGVTATF